ncbi:hypothetical protein AVEN_105532-1 [Araneus ventricosus]|uniref:HAT C-terminal dimerisation domain-containing protein n=1 Tax=Araneus ventricosus TaxID=182803 RepID=A0A4Y2CCE5_ARAVE|nr:hypothetical protein AVEN_105532-1 [Araneus ventricosus]
MSNCSRSGEKSKETLEEKSLTLHEKLEKVFHSKTKVLRCSSIKSSSLSKIVKQELQSFDLTENRSSNILKLSEVLKTIPPTSTEAEKVFSAAGFFITNLRSRLSDKCTDCLCFLKSYFKNE